MGWVRWVGVGGRHGQVAEVPFDCGAGWLMHPILQSRGSHPWAGGAVAWPPAARPLPFTVLRSSLCPMHRCRLEALGFDRNACIEVRSGGVGVGLWGAGVWGRVCVFLLLRMIFCLSASGAAPRPCLIMPL